MASGEKKVSAMDFLETVPDNAKIYVVIPGDTTPYYTTKAALLAGISGGSYNLQTITDGSGNNETTNHLIHRDGTKTISLISDGFECYLSFDDDVLGNLATYSSLGFQVKSTLDLALSNINLIAERNAQFGFQSQVEDIINPGKNIITNINFPVSSSIAGVNIVRTYGFKDNPEGEHFIAILSDIQTAILNLKDGVAAPGDTLQKLYNLIVGASSEVYVADIAARNTYNVPLLPFSIFVLDDGDGRWAKYQATTTGVGATFVKISDPDLLNAVMSNAAIKIGYESNADTNSFTNAFKDKLNNIAANATVNDTDINLKNRANHTGNQLAATISDFATAVNILIAPKQINLLKSDVTINRAENASATINKISGSGITASSGPTAVSIADTNLFTRTERTEFLTSSTSGTLSTFRQTSGYFSINTGFIFTTKFGASTNANLSGVRFTNGLFAANFIVTNVDPTTFINCLSFAKIDGSNNWNFIHNDSSGTATAIDLGSSFPANTINTDIYLGTIETSGANIKYTLLRLNTGDTVTGTISTNIPSASLLLSNSLGSSNNANASTVGLCWSGMQVSKF